jgi:hypothetical protein
MSERVANSAPTGGERAYGLSDEVEVYHRTYTTLLRSSGETRLRILEPSHRAMGSSLHPLAATEELDLGAFLYAVRRLPDEIAETRLIVLGQEPGQFADAGFDVAAWPEAEAPARRRLWRVGGPIDERILAVLVASGSDVDDLVPTLVAFQIEWNKLRARLRGSGEAESPTDPARLAAVLGGDVDDWQRLRESWGERFDVRLRAMPGHRCDLRLRTLGASNVGYARLTRD